MTKDDDRPEGEPGLDARLDRAVPHEPQAVGFLLAGDGTQPGRVFPLTRSACIIGRSDRADVRIVQAAVSGEHARITNNNLGFEIEDLGSVNGTFVNGVRITRAKLQRGDRLVLGNVEFTFLLERTQDSGMSLLPPGLRRTATLSNLRPTTLPPSGSAARAGGDSEEGPSFAEMVHKTVSTWNWLKPHLPLALCLGAVGGAIGAVSAFAVPPPSSAVCEARLDAVKKANPIDGEIHTADGDTLQYFTDPERSFVVPGLVRTTLESLDKKAPPEDLVMRVQSRLKLAPDGERTFKATYQEPIALLAEKDEPNSVALLDAHVKNYIQTDIDRGLKKLENEAKYLTDKLGAAVADLTKINSDLADFKKANADDLPESATQAQTSRSYLENRRTELNAQLSRLQSELASEEAHGQEDNILLQGKLEGSKVYRTSLQEVKRRRSEAQAKGLADGHPEVVQMNNEIVRLERLIQEEMSGPTAEVDRNANPVAAARRARIALLRGQVRAAHVELNDLDRGLERAKKTAVAMPAVAARLDDLLRQYETKKRLHDQLAAQAQKATLQLDVERLGALSRYEIVTPTYVVKPALGKTVGVRGGIGLGLALGLAALIVALREARKHLHHPRPGSAMTVRS